MPLGDFLREGIVLEEEEALPAAEPQEKEGPPSLGFLLGEAEVGRASALDPEKFPVPPTAVLETEGKRLNEGMLRVFRDIYHGGMEGLSRGFEFGVAPWDVMLGFFMGDPTSELMLRAQRPIARRPNAKEFLDQLTEGSLDLESLADTRFPEPLFEYNQAMSNSTIPVVGARAMLISPAYYLGLLSSAQRLARVTNRDVQEVTVGEAYTALVGQFQLNMFRLTDSVIDRLPEEEVLSPSRFPIEGVPSLGASLGIPALVSEELRPKQEQKITPKATAKDIQINAIATVSAVQPTIADLVGAGEVFAVESRIPRLIGKHIGRVVRLTGRKVAPVSRKGLSKAKQLALEETGALRWPWRIKREGLKVKTTPKKKPGKEPIITPPPPGTQFDLPIEPTRRLPLPEEGPLAPPREPTAEEIGQIKLPLPEQGALPAMDPDGAIRYKSSMSPEDEARLMALETEVVQPSGQSLLDMYPDDPNLRAMVERHKAVGDLAEMGTKKMGRYWIPGREFDAEENLSLLAHDEAIQSLFRQAQAAEDPAEAARLYKAAMVASDQFADVHGAKFREPEEIAEGIAKSPASEAVAKKAPTGGGRPKVFMKKSEVNESSQRVAFTSQLRKAGQLSELTRLEAEILKEALKVRRIVEKAKKPVGPEDQRALDRARAVLSKGRVGLQKGDAPKGGAATFASFMWHENAEINNLSQIAQKGLDPIIETRYEIAIEAAKRKIEKLPPDDKSRALTELNSSIAKFRKASGEGLKGPGAAARGEVPEGGEPTPRPGGLFAEEQLGEGVIGGELDDLERLLAAGERRAGLAPSRPRVDEATFRSLRAKEAVEKAGARPVELPSLPEEPRVLAGEGPTEQFPISDFELFQLGMTRVEVLDSITTKETINQIDKIKFLETASRLWEDAKKLDAIATSKGDENMAQMARAWQFKVQDRIKAFGERVREQGLGELFE
jgi:hypothetical protein